MPFYKHIKEIVHPKMKILSSFTYPQNVCQYFPQTIELIRAHQLFSYPYSSNIFLCVQDKREIHKDLQ